MKKLKEWITAQKVRCVGLINKLSNKENINNDKLKEAIIEKNIFE